MDWVLILGICSACLAALLVGSSALFALYADGEGEARAKAVGEAKAEGLQAGVSILSKQASESEFALRERAAKLKARDSVAVANELLNRKGDGP